MITITIKGLDKAMRTLNDTDSVFRKMSVRDFADVTAVKARQYLLMSIMGNNSGIWLSHGNPGLRTGGIKAIQMNSKTWSIVASSGNSGFDYASVVEKGRGPIRVAKWAKGPNAMFKKHPPMPLRLRNGGIMFRFQVGPAQGYHYMERTSVWARARFSRYMNAKVRSIMATKGKSEGYELALS